MIGLLSAGCGGDSDGVSVLPSPPPPSPSSAPAVTPGAHTGPTGITFLAAEPSPGSTLTGCRADASGCDGRIRMRFRLLNPTGGPVLYATAFLHAQNKLACWRGTTGSFRLEAAVASELLVVFDQRDPQACFAPNTIETMKLVVEGTVEVAALQEWSVRYTLQP